MQTLNFPPELWVPGLIAGALMATATGIFHISIMPAVNATLPPNEQIPIYDTDRNVFFVLRRHRELFPSSKQRTLMYTLMTSAGAILFVTFMSMWVMSILGLWPRR